MSDNLVSKGNQTMKFGELMEHNMKNIFLQKLCTKYGGENSSRLFLKKRKKNGHISASAVWNFIQFAFVVYSSWGLPKYIESKVLTTCFYLLHTNFFQNIKRCLELVSLTSFHCLIVFTFWNIWQYVHCNSLLFTWWRHEFWNLP